MTPPKHLFQSLAAALAGCGIALWFKDKQLLLLHADLPGLYPKFWWGETAVIGILIGLICFYGLLLFCRTFRSVRSSGKLKPYFGAFLFCFFTQAAFNGFLSPLNWDNPLAALNKVESFTQPGITTLLFGHYANAKRFDFSNFSALLWGGQPRGLMNHPSYPVAFLTFLFDLPSASIETFHLLLLILFFTFCVLSSFSFFLLLQKMRFSYYVSLLGSALFLLSNRFFAVKLTQNFPIHSISFLVLPLVLYFLVEAFEKKKAYYAALAGVVFSSNFYLLGSHPDGIMHCSLFIALFLAFHIYSAEFSKEAVVSALAFGIVSFATASYFLAPVFYGLISKEAYQWGHRDPHLFFYGWKEGFLTLGPIFLKLFGLFGVLLLWPKYVKGALKASNDFRFFAVLSLVMIFLLFPGTDGLLHLGLQALKITAIQFSRIERILTLVAFTVLFVFLYLMDEFLRSKPTRFSTAVNLLISLGSLWVVWSHRLLYPLELWVGGVLFVLSLYYLGRKMAPLCGVCAMIALSLSSTALILEESNFEFKSPKLKENPLNTRPYFSLSSVLAAMKSYPEDESANLKFLKNKLVQYEKDCLSDSRPLASSYSEALKHLGISSAKDLQPSQALEFALSVYPEVDKFYVAEFSRADQITEKMKVQLWGRNFYALNGKFRNLNDRFKLIRAATVDGEHFGVGAGYHVLDNTFAVDIRFSFAYQPIMALYVLPNYYFEKVGNYTDRNFYQLGTEVAKSALIRKRMSLAGVGAYTFKTSDWEVLDSKEKQGLIPLPGQEMNGELKDYIVVEDLQALPSFYLAQTVKKAKSNPDDLGKYRFPLSETDKDQFLQYQATVKKLESELDTLEGERSVLLENKEALPIRIGSGESKILNWIGPRMFAEVDCHESDCYAVFNMAKVSGWHAFVDQTETHLTRANFAFLATQVPVGKHWVWYEWHPWYLFASLFLSLASLLFLFIWGKTRVN